MCDYLKRVFKCIFGCFNRLETFSSLIEVQSSWEILVFLLAYLILVIDNARGIRLLGPHAGIFSLYSHKYYIQTVFIGHVSN